MFRLLVALIMIQVSSFAQIVDLNGNWKFHIGDKSAWASKEYDDSNWEYIHAPSAWENEGFNGYDGFAWYRKKFDGRKLDKNENYSLNLGFIDDTDEVYLNGKLIGFSGTMPPKFKTAYNSERNYSIPYEALNFNGDNLIAIRVYDVTLGGGIIDGDLGIFKGKPDKLLIDLQGIWSFKPSKNEERGADGYSWRNIIVPGPWEHQGYYKYDGFAWYKKTFSISPKLAQENLVLVLGKIDDFDKVYLNGSRIGMTNDRKPFGSSHSYEQRRVYNIPSDLLRINEPNTIEVLVEDIGYMGGFLEGPVGIISKSNYDRYLK